MDNTIRQGFGPQYSGFISHEQARRSEHTGYQTGMAGHQGKEASRFEEPQDRADNVKSFFRYDNGVKCTKFNDGTKSKEAPSGFQKNTGADDSVTICLPNGMTIREFSGEKKALDPSTNQFVPVSTEKNKAGETHLCYQDSNGNKWKVNPEKMTFEVQNPSETITQKIDVQGNIALEAKTLTRHPDRGIMEQNVVHLNISPDGKVTENSPSGKAANIEDIALNNNHINFTARKDINMGINFPYPIPYSLKGPMVKPDLPPPTMPPIFCPPPHIGTQPGFPSTITADPWQQQNLQGMPVMGDPYAPVHTPSGLIRKAEPDGSMFVSLPNGIVMNQLPGGACQAFDAKAPDKVLAVSTQPIFGPNGQVQDMQYSFRDAAGSMYSVYGKSPDFSVLSADQNVLQCVNSDGNIMIHAKTYHPKNDGTIEVKNHKALVGSGGSVHTFGKPGINVGLKNIVIARDGQVSNYSLPYEIPADQFLMPYSPPVGYMPGQIPVADPYQVNSYAPDPMNYQAPMGTPGAPFQASPGQVSQPGGPTIHVPKTSQEPPKADGATAEGAQGPVDPQNVRNEEPSQKPAKPGIWQRFKNFLTGEGDNKSNHVYPGYNNGYSPYQYGGYSYPGGYYNPYTTAMTGMAMGTMMATTAMSSAMMMRSFMPYSFGYPYGVYYSPFSVCSYPMYGGYGMRMFW